MLMTLLVMHVAFSRNMIKNHIRESLCEMIFDLFVFLWQSADSVQLALGLDGTKLEGRSIRVKRSLNKEKQKKSDSKGTTRGASRGPAKGPMKGPERERGGRHGGFKSPKKFSRSQQRSTKSSTSFKGEMVDPNKKTKKKGLKKKRKPNKTVHI